MAQLRRALASRVWIEQAKGVLAATQGADPDDAFQQLRARARSSSRKLADLAQEVVQEAQRERVAALAVDDARVRAAEARAREAEQALQAAQTGLAQRTAALDRAQDDADAARSGPPTSAEPPRRRAGAGCRPARPRCRRARPGRRRFRLAQSAARSGNKDQRGSARTIVADVVTFKSRRNRLLRNKWLLSRLRRRSTDGQLLSPHGCASGITAPPAPTGPGQSEWPLRRGGCTPRHPRCRGQAAVSAAGQATASW